TQVADMVQEVYPARIQLFTDILGIMENIANADPDAAVKLASTMKSLNNALKKNQGMVEGLQKSDIIERKQALEKEMLAHAQKTGKDAKILDELEAIRLESREQWFARMAESFGRFLVPGIGFSAWAYEYSTMKDKPEMERDLGFQDRDVNRMKQRNKQTQRNLVLSAQKQLLAYSFKQMAKLPAADQPEAYRALFVGKSAAEMDQAIDQWIESAFAKSQLQDLAYRESLLEKSTAELEAIDDPLLQYAIARFKENKPFEEAQKTREGKLSVLRPAYIALLRDTMKAKGKAVYPDANSSLRITFGTVKGYSPRDGVYHTPQTSTRGLIQKETGETPFRSPEPLLDLAQQKQFGPYLDKKLGDVPVNFLGTCDITGGNSGSATLDGQGRLVGLVFDGNYEAMSSDYDFDVDVTRSIHVDIRYILWVMDAVDGAHNLLTEMGVQPHFKTAKAATSGTP
ncbi:MAG: S46 family peptidase, partial [Acidobacteria bacterium]|nr:S46 family peptidase [Acidobacteriota bacterium]